MSEVLFRMLQANYHTCSWLLFHKSAFQELEFFYSILSPIVDFFSANTFTIADLNSLHLDKTFKLILFSTLMTGFEIDAAIRCPNSLLFSADYVYFGSDGTTACDTSTDNWNVCANQSVMTFDYSTCSQQIAFSCMYSKYILFYLFFCDHIIFLQNFFEVFQLNHGLILTDMCPSFARTD